MGVGMVHQNHFHLEPEQASVPDSLRYSATGAMFQICHEALKAAYKRYPNALDGHEERVKLIIDYIVGLGAEIILSVLNVRAFSIAAVNASKRCCFLF